MATDDVNLAERSGSLVESHKGYDPRIIFFYFVLAALLLTLAGGLAYQQLFKTGDYHERERLQNQRRVLVPGPRGNVYDRHGQLLVGNRPRFTVTLYLDELRSEIYSEYLRSRKAYRATGDKDLPTDTQLRQIARVIVVQRYLDQVNRITRRAERIDGKDLESHFLSRRLLPYSLIADLAPEEYARLIERLPIRSPLQVYTTSARYYPNGSAAAHTLGYVGTNSNVSAEDFPGEDLKTTTMRGTIGEAGLEKQFDPLLQGEAGGTIYRVDKDGYKVNPPLEKRLPVQGQNLTTSLDLALQRAAEEAIGDQTGAAVALDVATGEVLVLASKPDYNLAEFRKPGTIADIEARHAWNNLAVNGFWPPGSSFKILTSIAGLRRGSFAPDEAITTCTGTTRIAGHPFFCSNGLGHHGDVLLRDAIAQSCDIYFNYAGILITAEAMAAEARRFHLDRRTGIELPGENNRMLIPDPEWKKRVKSEAWFPGDSALMAMGQGFVVVSPLQMACFAASVARNEVFTQPTLVHQENRPPQHTEAIGLTTAQRAALIEGMEGCLLPPKGTARNLTMVESLRVPGIRIAGKTGTAQKTVTKDGKTGTINYAWFICFAPVENPQIAMAVAIEGDTIGEEFGGGFHAGPVASAVLKKYFAQKNRPAPLLPPVRMN
ncbi:MAG: peptidoglycan glycosyltransferase [Opitutus sp.]|nr:peptidoglycan glycosyltransferase [Opitutus sp.]